MRLLPAEPTTWWRDNLALFIAWGDQPSDEWVPLHNSFTEHSFLSFWAPSNEIRRMRLKERLRLKGTIPPTITAAINMRLTVCKVLGKAVLNKLPFVERTNDVDDIICLRCTERTIIAGLEAIVLKVGRLTFFSVGSCPADRATYNKEYHAWVRRSGYIRERFDNSPQASLYRRILSRTFFNRRGDE